MDEYMHCLDVIATTNHIEEADPADCLRMPERQKLPSVLEDENDIDDDQSNKSDGLEKQMNESYFASEGSQQDENVTGTNQMQFNFKDADDFSKALRKLQPDCLPSSDAKGDEKGS